MWAMGVLYKFKGRFITLLTYNKDPIPGYVLYHVILDRVVTGFHSI